MKLALLRKDLRLLRLPLVGGAVLALLPYLLYVPLRLPQWWLDRHDTVDRSVRRDGVVVVPVRPEAEWANKRLFARGLFPAALTGLGLVALTAAACGGIAFAAERRDRSAEFLAMLPVTRRRVVASKLLAAAACLLAPAAVHLAVLALGWRELSRWEASFVGFEQQFFIGAANCAALALMMFGVAWLLSSFFDSPAVAGTVAVGVAALTVYLIATFSWQAEVAANTLAVSWTPPEYVVGFLWRPVVFVRAPSSVHDAVRLVALIGGAAALLAGTLVYARRVRP